MSSTSFLEDFSMPLIFWHRHPRKKLFAVAVGNEATRECKFYFQDGYPENEVRPAIMAFLHRVNGDFATSLCEWWKFDFDEDDAEWCLEETGMSVSEFQR